MSTQKVPEAEIPTLKLFEGASEWPIKDMVHHELIQTRVKGHKGKIRTHRHLDLFHIFYLSQGSARTILDGEQSTVHGPLVVTVPPLCIHGIAPLEELRGHLLTLPGSSLRYLLRNAESDAELTEKACIIEHISKEQTYEIDNLFRQIERESKNDANSRFMAMQSLLRLTLVWIIRRSLESRSRAPVANDRSATRIRRFKKLIEENFTRGLSIKEYANHMGISTAQLNNICRAKVGKSALQIVHERLTLEIKRNLVYTSLTVSQIAYELGFSDPAYLTRFFGKQTGLSPKQYRSGARPTMPEFVDAPDINPGHFQG